ncbi:MAG: hypothetical protein QM783_00860 [Phycisphaerales bacterium]
MRVAAFACSVSVVLGAAVAQPSYTFEMRLIPDGVPGSPTGPGTSYNIGSPMYVVATRVGFWLQARVMQSAGENWGIVRATSPEGGASFITMSSTLPISLNRGTVNASNTIFGRAIGYCNAGEPSGNTDNTDNSQPFPSVTGNANGGLDSTRPDGLINRVYGFDAWVGATRTAQDLEEPSQPWNVNGRANSGSPIPAGEFSPWASLYRVWIDMPGLGITPSVTVTLNASAWLIGSLQAAPTNPEGTVWEMQPGPGQLATASSQFTVSLIPTPSAAALLALGGGFACRRR